MIKVRIETPYSESKITMSINYLAEFFIVGLIIYFLFISRSLTLESDVLSYVLASLLSFGIISRGLPFYADITKKVLNPVMDMVLKDSAAFYNLTLLPVIILDAFSDTETTKAYLLFQMVLTIIVFPTMLFVIRRREMHAYGHFLDDLYQFFIPIRIDITRASDLTYDLNRQFEKSGIFATMNLLRSSFMPGYYEKFEGVVIMPIINQDTGSVSISPTDTSSIGAVSEERKNKYKKYLQKNNVLDRIIKKHGAGYISDFFEAESGEWGKEGIVYSRKVKNSEVY